MVAEKQDANLVGFYKIREATLGTVPATGAWQTREPNTFDDLGGEYTKTQRRPFSPSRQRKKGQTTDLDADGGYNEDVTQNNMQNDFEEFFFAALRPTPTADPTSVTTTLYNVDDEGDLIAGCLVLASGFGVAANNGLKELTAVGSGTLTASGLATEGSPPAAAVVKGVGFAFATADVALTTPTAGVLLTVSTADFSDFPHLVEGSWVFFDMGDSVNVGYARIAKDGVGTTTLLFDKTTWTPAAEGGTGLDATIYFSDVLKNEDDVDLIVRYSSVIERTLGRDDNGVQSEYITGAVPNELTWNSPLSNLVNVDLSYIGQRVGTRDGTAGPLSARGSNTRIAAGGEEAFNTSSNIYRLRMAMIDPTTLNPSPFFARVTEWDMSIANNVSGAKGQGVLGAFDAIVGNFDVDLNVTAYFQTIEAIHAVKCNWDATYDAIYAKANAGLYIDLPLLSLGGGRLNIEQDSAIMLPLENAAAESVFGHTALMGWFAYLPDEAMPDSDC